MLILTHEFSTTQLNEDYNEIYIVTEAFSTSADDSQFIFFLLQLSFITMKLSVKIMSNDSLKEAWI